MTKKDTTIMDEALKICNIYGIDGSKPIEKGKTYKPTRKKAIKRFLLRYELKTKS